VSKFGTNKMDFRLCNDVRKVQLNEEMGKTYPFHEDLTNTFRKRCLLNILSHSNKKH